MARGGYPWDIKANVVPSSDGAGTVLAVGKHVTRFQPGDSVITMLHQQHIAGSVDPRIVKYGIGATLDGTLQTVGTFNEQGLVAMPKGLSFIEASTLSCAGLTAWNALFGLPGKQVTAGQWVLTQGTGGVSLFAVQFAKAVGARVIATTSSSEKGKILEKLGADHVVEVAGPTSIAQSVASLKLDGTLSVIGSVGGGDGKEVPNLIACWMHLFTARGVWVGNRMQMEDMCRAIEANPEKLRPVINPKVFTLDQVKEAYEYQWAGKHQGKIGIEIS